MEALCYVVQCWRVAGPYMDAKAIIGDVPINRRTALWPVLLYGYGIGDGNFCMHQANLYSQGRVGMLVLVGRLVAWNVQCLSALSANVVMRAGILRCNSMRIVTASCGGQADHLLTSSRGTVISSDVSASGARRCRATICKVHRHVTPLSILV